MKLLGALELESKPWNFWMP